MIIIFAGCVAVVTTAVWLGAFVFVPSCQRSFLRYDLWALRDALMDDVLVGRIPMGPDSLRLINQIEGAIRGCKTMTLADLISFLRACRREPQLLQAQCAVHHHVPHPDPDVALSLASYQERTVERIVQHVMHGSPLAWLSWTFLAPAIFFRVVDAGGSRRPKQVAETAVRRELAAPSRLFSNSVSPLAAYAA